MENAHSFPQGDRVLMTDNMRTAGNPGPDAGRGTGTSVPKIMRGSFGAYFHRRIVPKGLAQTLIGLIASAYHAGLPHLIVSTVLVQGLAYLTQLYIAQLLGPRAFGVVRNTEAIISILILLGAAGMPSLAIKSISEVTDPALRARLLGRLLQIAGLSGIALSAIGLLLLPAFVTAETRPYLAQLVWIVGLSAVGRTAINYFQGIRQFQRMAALNVILSSLAVTLLVLMVWRSGLSGWIIGRYAGEGLFVGGSLLLLTPHIKFAGSLPPPYSRRKLLVLGLTIASSLALRTMLDHAALLALAYCGRTSEEIGCYGLGSLVVATILLFPGATATLAITRFVEKSATPDLGRVFYHRVIKWTLAVIVPCAGLLALCGPLLPAVFGSGYLSAVSILQILALTLPVRTVAALTGSVLMAHDMNRLTLCTNSLFLVLGVLLYGILIPAFGPVGAAWVTVFLETGSAVLLVYFCRVRVWCK